MQSVIARRILRALVALCLSVAALVVNAAPVQFDEVTILQLQTAMASGKLTSEQLVKLCLARINAFDRQGPGLHAIIALNPDALKEARALDAERRSKGPRSPLHGIPVLVKDNYNTVEMPTTGGSIRGPATVNGIVGLKPTHGLLSREGIIPLSLSFDTGGPMARSVTDIAVALGQLTGVDSDDEATRKSEGKFQSMSTIPSGSSTPIRKSTRKSTRRNSPPSLARICTADIPTVIR